MSNHLSQRTAPSTSPLKEFFKPENEFSEIEAKGSISSSGMVTLKTTLHGKERIISHLLFLTSCQGEDTLSFSNWGGCKIPKNTISIFVHLIE